MLFVRFRSQEFSAPVRLGLWHFALLLVCFFCLRLVLLTVSWSHLAASPWQVTRAFLIGLHLDCFIALVLTVPLFFWLALFPPHWGGTASKRALAYRILFKFLGLLYWTGLFFLLVVEYGFFDEFNSRFNSLVVDYILYPYEVFINIWDSYPVLACLGACLLAGFVVVFATGKLQAILWKSNLPGKRRWSRLALLLLVVLALGWTISFKEARFSRDRLLNEIANNDLVSLTSAVITRDLEFEAFYQALPPDVALARARQLLEQPGIRFVAEPRAQNSAPYPSLLRQVSGDSARPRLNVVVILEESFGSEFWGCLGRPGASLTPQMDRLAASEGLLFTNFYATGNRTVRGLEGVLCSFPPLPGDSIVGRAGSERVETLARVLKRDGYATVFMYGGRSLFDNMRSFFLRNGYDRFLERKDFSRPNHTTIWGVCDEDLFAKARQECRSLSAQGKPFLATLLTVSNHKPYTYPPGRIAENPQERRRENAVKYTDYALGQFFQQVKNEPFYTNTIFVVVADHGARVYGSQQIPIRSYEIPFLIAGPAVVKKPQTIGAWGCSMDVAPTVLGLIGRPYTTVFFGRNLLQGSTNSERVCLQHNRDIGLFRSNHLVVLGLNKTLEFYHGNPKGEEMQPVLQPDAADTQLQNEAVALFQAADLVYRGMAFSVP